MARLLHRKPQSLLCFGGQARNEHLCRLKSAVTGLPVYAFPGLNAAVYGTALRFHVGEIALSASFRLRTDPRGIRYGLAGYGDPAYQSIWGMLETPFATPRPKKSAPAEDH